MWATRYILRCLSAVCALVLAYTAYSAYSTIGGVVNPIRHTAQELPQPPTLVECKATCPDQLLYRRSPQLRQFVQRMHSSGEMLSIVRKVAKTTKQLPQSFPTIDFTGYSFSSVDGKSLDADRFINRLLVKHRSPRQPITNVVHHFALSDGSRRYSVSFLTYVSLLSSLWVSGADLVIVWLNKQPAGRHWQLFLRNVTQSGASERVVFGNTSLPQRVFGTRMFHTENKVDVMKLQIQILLGGIFVDNDVVTVRSLQPLRKHSFVIGRETTYSLCAGTVMSAPASPFAIIWYLMYQAYYPDQWAVFAVMLPHHLWKSRPNLCHVEEDTMDRPNWTKEERILLYKDLSHERWVWNWRRNYMMHFWSRLEKNFDTEAAQSANSIFAQVTRRVLFGSD